jgi:hypothetical protein
MAALVSALGAGPKGVSGVQSGGNKAGDIVRAHGTALYKRDGEQWVASAGPASAPRRRRLCHQHRHRPGGRAGRDARGARLGLRGDVPGPDGHRRGGADVAQTSIRARLARANAGYAIAAGPEQGQYLRFARALAEPGAPRMQALVTFGGEQNLELLRDGKVQVALAQADAALAAYEGTGPFEERGAAPTLRAIGSLYPEGCT